MAKFMLKTFNDHPGAFAVTGFCRPFSYAESLSEARPEKAFALSSPTGGLGN
jgi:hypothetical protein